MTINNVDTSMSRRKPGSRPAFWSICFLALGALVAFCLSLVLLTACGQSNVNPNPSQSNSVSQEADDGNAGFVVEDTAVVNVEIDE